MKKAGQIVMKDRIFEWLKHPYFKDDEKFLEDFRKYCKEWRKYKGWIALVPNSAKVGPVEEELRAYYIIAQIAVEDKEKNGKVFGRPFVKYFVDKETNIASKIVPLNDKEAGEWVLMDRYKSYTKQVILKKWGIVREEDLDYRFIKLAF